MLLKLMLVTALVLAPLAPAQAQDAGAVIATASKAMGADTLKTLTYSGSGFDFAFGQAFSPADPWPKFQVKSYTRSLDFDRPASRADRVRAQFENPPRGGGQQPLAGDQNQSQVIIVDGSTPWLQQLEIWMTPHGFLKAAATRNPTLRAQTIRGKRYSVISFNVPGAAPVAGYINDQNLVERVWTRIDSPMLGDMDLIAEYSDYRDHNGVKFPAKIVVQQGGAAILDLAVSEVQPNAAVTIQPQGRAGGAPAAAPAAAPVAGGGTVPTEQIADGVFLIRGAGAISMAIEFRDHVAVIEGPGNEARGETVIAETKRLIPNKPIRYLINTHHHFDHSSGMRPFAAEGARIVTHEVNADYFKRTLAAPRTLSPDRQQQAKKAVVVEGVGDKKVLTDGNQTIELYHIRENRHNAGLLMIYLPKQKFLVQADMFNAPAQPGGTLPMPLSVYTQNFLTNLDRLKLDVARVIPIHYPADGRVISYADMMRAVGRN